MNKFDYEKVFDRGRKVHYWAIGLLLVMGMVTLFLDPPTSLAFFISVLVITISEGIFFFPFWRKELDNWVEKG